MPRAARVSDSHVCPVSDPKPHVGGPVASGCTSVRVGHKAAARAGDLAICAGPIDVIAKGSSTVLIGEQEAARLGDLTVHGGAITSGEASVLIGVPWQAEALLAASIAGTPFCEICALQDPGDEAGSLPAQALSLEQAAITGAPFCEICE